MLIDTISVGGVVVWVGKPERSGRKLVEVAKWREKFPTVRELLVTRLKLPAEHVARVVTDGDYWNALTHVRFDDGHPVEVTAYLVSPLGSLWRYEL